MFVDAHPEPGETPQFRGSAVIIQANSAKEVLEILSKDIYVEKGVWDLDNVQIIPVSFFSSFRVLVEGADDEGCSINRRCGWVCKLTN